MFFNENSRKNSRGVQVEISGGLSKCARNGDKVRQAKDHFDFDVQSEEKSRHNFAALQNISSILQNRPEFLDLVTSKKKVSPVKMRPRPTYRDFLPNRISSNATLMNSTPHVPPHVVTWIHSGGQVSFDHSQRIPKVYQVQPGLRDDEEESSALTRLIKMCGKCFGDESDDSSSGGSSSDEGSDGGSDDDDDDADGGDEVSIDDDSGGGDSGSDDDDGDGDDDSIDTDALDDDIANDQWNNMDGDNMDGGSVDGGMSMGSDFSDSLTELRAGGRNFFGSNSVDANSCDTIHALEGVSNDTWSIYSYHEY